MTTTKTMTVSEAAAALEAALTLETQRIARLGIVQSRRMTYEEFLAWQPEGGLTEWVEGEGVQYVSTSQFHQDLVGLLYMLLRFFLSSQKMGRVFTGPYTMRIRESGNAREPDVFVVLNDNPGQVLSREFLGSPDVAIEVISDESVYRDRTTKFDEYEAAGVREYWLIDPRPSRRRADFYRLDEMGRYQTVPLGAAQIFRSAVVAGFWLNTDWLWQEDPNMAELVQEIMR